MRPKTIRPASRRWWPSGAGQWFQVAMLVFVLGYLVCPTIVHYWLAINRLGGFFHCLRIFLSP